jgi:hypothetical protein
MIQREALTWAFVGFGGIQEYAISKKWHSLDYLEQ